MRLYLSFLKYLRPHWGKLLLATLLGVLFGVSSGIGLPTSLGNLLQHISGGSSGQYSIFSFGDGSHYILTGINFTERSYVVTPCDAQGNPENGGSRTVQAPNGQYPSLQNASADVAAGLGKPESGFTQSAMLLLVFAVPMFFLVRACTGYASGILSNRVAIEIGIKLQQDVFDKLQAMPLAFFDQHQRGDLQTRLSRDTGLVQSAMLDSAPDMMRLPFQTISAIGALVYESYQMHDITFLLSFLLVVPICLLPVQILGRNLRKRSREQTVQAGNVAQHLWENFNAIQEIRSFSIEEAQKRGFNQKLRAYYTSEFKIKKYNLLQQPSMELLVSVLVSGVIIYAYKHSISIATLAALGATFYFAFDPIKRIGQALNRLHQAEPNGQRLRDFLALKVDIADPPNPKALAGVRGEIAFNHVTFAYGETTVLHDVSVTVPAGCNCALVGHSGAGKSTFAKLIPRFYEVRAGSVTLDGVDVREVRQADLRRHVAVVSQFPVLFDLSIMENIRLGRPTASDEEVYAAARRAHADEFIRSFPEGYNTTAGDRGDRLSGGQKQRLALARAFLKDAPVLVLDEAMSALDSESEQAVQAALTDLTRGRTVVTIAHRMSTIRNATMILVFEEGRLIARGSHAELMKNSPQYQSLVNSQLGGHDSETPNGSGPDPVLGN